jgi:hypothetical protein
MVVDMETKTGLPDRHHRQQGQKLHAHIQIFRQSFLSKARITNRSPPCSRFIV